MLSWFQDTLYSLISLPDYKEGIFRLEGNPARGVICKAEREFGQLVRRGAPPESRTLIKVIGPQHEMSAKHCQVVIRVVVPRPKLPDPPTILEILKDVIHSTSKRKLLVVALY